MIPHDDRGLLLGDGLFETLLALDGRLVWAEAHLDRLDRGCAALGLPAPGRAAAIAAMSAAIEGAGLATGRAAVRLTLTAGSGGRGLDRAATPEPRLFASAAPASAAGADEALLLNGRGEAACAAAANLFWIREGRLFTPALDCGVLDGVTRDVVLAAARSAKVEAVEVRAGPDDVVRADGAFLTNSLIGVRPISHLEGRAMPASLLTSQLARAVERATA